VERVTRDFGPLIEAYLQRHGNCPFRELVDEYQDELEELRHQIDICREAELREALRGVLDFLLERVPALPRSLYYYAQLIDPDCNDDRTED
jgi:hypothetical protein